MVIHLPLSGRNQLHLPVDFRENTLGGWGGGGATETLRTLPHTRPCSAAFCSPVLAREGGTQVGLGGCVLPRPPNVDPVLERICNRGDTLF